jgi:hypothetical protein
MGVEPRTNATIAAGMGGVGGSEIAGGQRRICARQKPTRHRCNQPKPHGRIRLDPP